MSLGVPSGAPGLAEVFEDESLGELDRTLAAAALARFGDARGAGHLVARIESEGDDRPIAAEWAGRLGGQDSIPASDAPAGTAGAPSQGAPLRTLGRLKAPRAAQRLARTAT